MDKIKLITLGLLMSCSVMADDSLMDLTTTRLPTGGVYKATTDGTNVTLTVNKLKTSSTVTLSGGATISGTTTTTTAQVGQNLTVGTNATVGALVSSYGYPIVVGHTNGSAQVMLHQFGNVLAAPEVASTNAFTVSYIATPSVVITESAASTNATHPYVTISTNQFVVTGVTNFSWQSIGRIK